MNIVSFGSLSPGSTVAHRAAALRRLGHNAITLNPVNFIGRHGRVASWFHYRTGYRFLQTKLLRELNAYFKSFESHIDLLWIDSGQFVGVNVLRHLKTILACPIILYCNDDPTGTRDKPRFSSLRSALPLYDLCVFRRDSNELEWLALGARKVLRVWMSYDEIIHQLSHPSSVPNSELLFVGTNIPTERRDFFLSTIIQSGIPLSIYGARWQRSPYWPQLRPFIKGPSLADREYSERLSKSALCLGLLSRHNRDLHTRRSVEVPSAGSILIAERTSEHKLLYEEQVEALFWSSVQECCELSLRYLCDNDKLTSLRHYGHQRVLSLGLGNEDICKKIIATVFSS